MRHITGACWHGSGMHNIGLHACPLHVGMCFYHFLIHAGMHWLQCLSSNVVHSQEYLSGYLGSSTSALCSMGIVSWSTSSSRIGSCTAAQTPPLLPQVCAANHNVLSVHECGDILLLS